MPLLIINKIHRTYHDSKIKPSINNYRFLMAKRLPYFHLSLKTEKSKEQSLNLRSNKLKINILLKTFLSFINNDKK